MTSESSSQMYGLVDAGYFGHLDAVGVEGGLLVVPDITSTILSTDACAPKCGSRTPNYNGTRCA